MEAAVWEMGELPESAQADRVEGIAERVVELAEQLANVVSRLEKE